MTVAGLFLILQLVAGTLVEGTANTYTDGINTWAGNPYCGSTGFLLQPTSPAIDTGVIIPDFHCPVAGSALNQPLNSNGEFCQEWYGTGPDAGACESVLAAAPPPATTETYLSDLTWVSAINGWGPVERDMSNGESLAGDGHPLTIRGVTYAKGLGVHAISEIVFALNGNYTTFSSSVGVDDEASGGVASVVFQVFVDGMKQYDSGVLTHISPVNNVSLNVAGKGSLRLVVTDAGDGIGYDHADWADAKLTITVQPAAPIAPTNLQVQVQ